MLNRRRMMMQALSPAEDAWSYAWDYTMGAPDTALWDYPVGDGAVSLVGDDGLYFYAPIGNYIGNYAGLRLKDFAAWLGQKAVYEIEVKVISTNRNGFRILCTSGSNGASDGRGLQVTINNNYFNVLTGRTNLWVATKTAPLTYGEWHKARLELDTPAGSNRVYLDDTLVATVANTDLSTQSADKVWCLIQSGEVYVRAVRYRKED